MKSSYNIFSTPVWHIGGIPQPLRDELYYGAYNYKERYESTTKSNQGGYQSNGFEWESFHPQGKEYINNVVSKIIEGENSAYYKNFKVNHWWYNINSKEHWNIPHTHPLANLALVFYLTDSDGLLRTTLPGPPTPHLGPSLIYDKSLSQ